MKNQKEIAWIKKDKYSDQESPFLTTDILRLKKGEPVDYIIGWREFLGCHIDLSFRPLIPRVETEEWAEQACRCISESTRKRTDNLEKKLQILDLCAGSGCIGLAVLKHCPGVKVDFVDQSLKAIKQIEKNILLNKIPKDRVGVFRSNLFSALDGEKYDFILTNPPYIPAGRKLPVSVEKWEPAQALFGGEDGLRFVKKILKEAPKHLNQGGELWLEFDTKTRPAIEKYLSTLSYGDATFYRDHSNRFRWMVVKNN